jgi:N-acetylmuramic acid 6-phosphate etherase
VVVRVMFKLTLQMNTESINPDTTNLDSLETLALVRAFADDQTNAVAAVQRAAHQLAVAVDAVAARLSRGGRLMYAGAGTSGRLAYLDSSELTPTFSWSAERARVAMAGGQGAVFKAVEGAEDDRDMGARDVTALEIASSDVLIGIAASGATPYVLGALEVARAVGALTVGFSNNPDAPVLTNADCPVLLETGAEVISGSTRLKAGTAQKIALNTLSSAVMVRLHKVYGNLMVDLQATNAKLRRRAVRLTCLASDADETTATKALESCDWQVKTAIVMIRRSLNADAARARLEMHAGSVRDALET